MLRVRSEDYPYERGACRSPVLFAGEKEGNHLPLLFRALHTAGNRETIRCRSTAWHHIHSALQMLHEEMEVIFREES